MRHDDVARELSAYPSAPSAEVTLLSLALDHDVARTFACELPLGAWTVPSGIVLAPIMAAEQDAGRPTSRVGLVEAMIARGLTQEQRDDALETIDYADGNPASARDYAATIRERYEARVAVLKCEATAAQIRRRPDLARDFMRGLVNDTVEYAAANDGGFRHASLAMAQAFTDSQRRAQGDMTGSIVTGVEQLDYGSLDGLERGDLITVVMVSGHGKTAWLAYVSMCAALQGTGVGFFSCEMVDRQIARRWASLLTGVPFGDVRKWNLHADQLERLVRAQMLTETLPLFIDDTGTPSLAHVLTQARRLKRQRPDLGIVAVDYMTLIQGTGQNFTEQYNTTVRGMKRLAKELDVAVIGLVQPDARTIEKRGDDEQMPRMDDIAWCQEFRNQSDAIIVGHRPGKSAMRHMLAGASTLHEDRKARFAIPKSRNTAGSEWTWSWWGGAMAFNGGCWTSAAERLRAVGR